MEYIWNGVPEMVELINGWYCTNVYSELSEDQKKNNANKAMKQLRQNGFTKYAAAGIVGNMWAESGLSPGQWNGGNEYQGAYGLLQWYPYTAYADWAGADWENNGDKQMLRLLYERDNNLEFWHNNSVYPTWTWTKYQNLEPEEGLSVDETINLAARVFVYRYLAPGDPEATMTNRQYHARWVYYNAPGNWTPDWLLLKWADDNRKRMWR